LHKGDDDDDDGDDNNNNNCGDGGRNSSIGSSCDGSVRNIINTFTIHRHVSIIHTRLSSEYGAVSLHTFANLSTASADVPLSSFPPVYIGQVSILFSKSVCQPGLQYRRQETAAPRPT